MIITRLKGGLGNQLFQYAAGFRLASIRKAELKLDFSEFDNPDYRTPRSYELGVFEITAEGAGAHDKTSTRTLWFHQFAGGFRSVFDLVRTLRR